VESVWSDYDFAAKAYLRRDDNAAQQRAAPLQSLRRQRLAVFTLEYAAPNDAAWVEQLIGRSRTKGFVPYVSTIGLDRVFSHTLPR
jgi:endo-alpha-1,4-polygalactosaminidase (GH114 family)